LAGVCAHTGATSWRGWPARLLSSAGGLAAGRLAIFGTLAGWIADGSLWGHVLATLAATGAGYALGSLAGILVGLVLGFLPGAALVSAPFITALYALPKVALAPLFVIFFGIGLESKVALVAATVFFLLLYNTQDGVRDIDQDLVHAAFLMGATRPEVTRLVMLPAALPWIFTGLRIAVRYAFTAAILGELIAANRGIGFLIEYSAGQFDTAGVYAAVLVLVVFSVLIQELLVRAEVSTQSWRL
jgi:NitT/TauT family transport system permease protein